MEEPIMSTTYSDIDLPAIGKRVVSGNATGTVVDYGWTRYELAADRVVIVDWDGGDTPTPIQPRYLRDGDRLNCGHTSHPDGFAAGFARDALGYTLCYACAAESDRQELRMGRPIVAYVDDSDARPAYGVPARLTTWAGEYLGRVSVTDRPAAHKRYVSGYVDGIEIYGSGPIENGTYVTVHPSKACRHA
jgi:hypothetical protein